MASRRRDAPRRESAPLSPPRRILVLAPHPDDEIVACGIAALRARNAGAEVLVYYLTTGIPPRELLWPRQVNRYAELVTRRRDEAIEAAPLMALKTVGFLEIPSRQLTAHLDAAASAIDRALAETSAECLWVTAFEGAHQDHDAANALAEQFRDRLSVWEFAAYNYANGRVRSNRFIDARGGVIELRLTREESALKRQALALYASQRHNLAHIKTVEEAYRPLPNHDYAARPHAGKLFRERFHWVPFRHPRIDFTPSAGVYGELGRWSAARRLDITRETEG